MLEMVMPRNLKILADRGSRGTHTVRQDRHSIAINGYAIKACSVPMHSMSEIRGFDESI
jgi:hypothetical protein